MHDHNACTYQNDKKQLSQLYFDQPVGIDKSETVERESMTIQQFYFLIKQELMNFPNDKNSKM